MFKFLRLKRSEPAPAAPATDAPGPDAGGPNLPRRADPETILRRVEWTVIRRLDGLLQGDYRTLLRGFGLDLADLREYQAHDDVRYMDWNVTARLQVPHVREFQEDREVTAWFVMDLSGSVDFGSRDLRKRELAAELAGTLARLLTRHGNRVGALLHGRDEARVKDGVETIAPREEVLPVRGGRRQVLHLIDRIAAMQTGAPENAPSADSKKDAKRKNAQPQGRETDLGALLQRAQQLIKRRSVIFVVSDFISTPGWTQALTLLAQRHEVIAVRLYDPMELELPPLGLVVLQDAETGEQLFVDTHDSRFRERFAELAIKREEELRDTLSTAGVDCLELSTDEDLHQALLRFIDLRRRRSRLGAGASAGPSRLAELHG